MLLYNLNRHVNLTKMGSTEMNIDEMKLGDLKRIAAAFSAGASPTIDNGMVGSYVIVRCSAAGVHAGVLESYNGRECVLTDSRRLWYWKPANNAAFLSGVATEGLHSDSKVGAPIRVHLTENCEIIACTKRAEASIRAQKNHVGA